MYFNAAMCKTVRRIPGFAHAEANTVQAKVVAVAEAKAATNTNKSSATAAAVDKQAAAQELQHHDVYDPIDFEKAMTVEGHESQVVHVRTQASVVLVAVTLSLIFGILSTRRSA